MAERVVEKGWCVPKFVVATSPELVIAVGDPGGAIVNVKETLLVLPRRSYGKLPSETRVDCH